MNELERIGRLVALLPARGEDVVIGPGEDDAAAWREPDGTFMIATCDTAVETVHFDLARQRPEAVGWRALAFALGDVAAKGAKPHYALVSITIPRKWAPHIAEGIYGGISNLAREVGVQVVGGDTTSAPELGAITITALGRTSVRPIPRSAAKPGWCVGVTGALGGASLEWEDPRPLLERGAELARRGVVCGDISDGLVREMDKVLAASRVGAEVDADRVPVAEGATTQLALVNGEEVQLVCLAPEELLNDVTIVGRLIPEPKVVVLEGGHEIELRERGFDHFA